MGEQRKRIVVNIGGLRSGRRARLERARQTYVTAADLKGPRLDLLLAPEGETAVVQGLERAHAETERRWAEAFDRAYGAPCVIDGTAFYEPRPATLASAPDLEIWAWRDRGRR